MPVGLDSRGSTRYAEREKLRRVRLSSTLLLMITVIWLTAIPIFFITLGSDPATLPTTVIGLLAIAALLFMNRRGWVTAIAWLLIVLIYLSFLLILRNNQSTLGPDEVAVFDLLIYTDLLAVSLLPPLTVFPVALLNSALILVAIFSLRSPADAFNQPAFLTNVVVEPLTLQLFVAVVTYLWVASTERALARADQAELMAALERRTAEERRLLEADIQQVQGALTRVANGDVNARVTLSQDRSLWQVGMSLNTLLTRMQGADVANQTLRRTEEEVLLLANVLRDARAGRPARWSLPPGSVLEPLLRELESARPPSEQPPKPPRRFEGGSGSSGRSRPLEE
jgi:hypothetical protein